MKKSELLKLIKEELQGYSPQIGKTKGLTPDTLNKILKKIADDTEDEVSEIDNPVDRITLDIPLFIRLLEYAKEDAKTDMDLHDVAEKAIQLGSVQNTALSMDDYDSLVGKQEVEEKKRPGLWANINAKRKRGEKPSHGNSNAHKDAVAAGNAMKK